MSERAQGDQAILGYLEHKQPLGGGPIDADDVTSVALHLLSDEARMVTGQVVTVDGGWSVSEPRAG
jgi:enoyl-[acyl-carrier-protein] reductase (NADH)